MLSHRCPRTSLPAGAGANPTRTKKPSKGGCPFLRSSASAAANFQAALLAGPLDVEELARLGRQQAVCPYYGSRRAVPSADVLLVPYSAVLQPETRRSLGIELEGSVVIFDEAHNLLDAINGAHSAAVTGGQERLGGALRSSAVVYPHTALLPMPEPHTLMRWVFLLGSSRLASLCLTAAQGLQGTVCLFWSACFQSSVMPYVAMW
jgi:hypothetical protein